MVTAVELPDSIDGGKVPGALRKLGITANGGQEQLKGRILRIAHCGYFGAFDILTSLSGLEMVLSQLGHEVEHGAGVGAAQRVFVEAGVAAAPSRLVLEQQYRVLVKEKIADSGVNMLRERFAVDLGVDWTDEELAERIGGYHGILIRSATQLTAELIGRADNLRVIGRAGIGVDNVDVEAATKRGIIVANAPQSNIVAAAEHTVALMLALARNIPQAHAVADRRPVGALEVRRRRGLREDARRARLRPHRPARGRARPGLRHARARLRPVRLRPSASASSGWRRRSRAPTSTARPTSSPSTCPRRPRRAAGSTPRRSRR